jgi:ATP phosphoribosyltransferase
MKMWPQAFCAAPVCYFPTGTNGGHFTYRNDGRRIGVRRGKDIAALVLGKPERIGIVGSDVYDELPDDIQDRLAFEPFAETDVSFVIAAKRPVVANIFEVILAGGTLNIATSYPRKSAQLAKRFGFQIGKLQVLGGKVEAAIDDNPETDAIVEMRQTGTSLDQENLAAVLDERKKIAVGLICNR